MNVKMSEGRTEELRESQYILYSARKQISSAGDTDDDTLLDTLEQSSDLRCLVVTDNEVVHIVAVRLISSDSSVSCCWMKTSSSGKMAQSKPLTRLT